MKPSTALADKRDLLRATVARYHSANPRVFGSALRGDDHDGSDLDLLVDALPGATLFDLGGLQVGSPHTRRSPAEVSRPRPGRGRADMTGIRLPDYLDHLQEAARQALRIRIT
jgi:hypothetical protein